MPVTDDAVAETTTEAINDSGASSAAQGGKGGSSVKGTVRDASTRAPRTTVRSGRIVELDIQEEELTHKPSPPKLVRLSVNLNQESADALKAVSEKKGISYTEAVRRAIAIGKFVDDAVAVGSTIQVVDANGNVREAVLL